MALTRYVSAQWVPDDTGDEAAGSIRARGDDGVDYWITPENSDVPPWPQFLAEGGIVLPPTASAADNIIKAPPGLVGGPKLAEIFDRRTSRGNN